eukprot:4090719-Prymnesium_polylepis.1
MAQFITTVRLDFWQVGLTSASKTAVILNTSATGIFKLVNRYGGLRWAWQSGGALIGFRDGIDFLDVNRFPAAEYGQPYGSRRVRQI